MIPLVAKAAIGIAAGVAAWESAWWLRRRARRSTQYDRAVARARELGRPLVVIGAPDAGATSGYGCGDLTIDLVPSSCPNAVQADITKSTGLDADSVVVFCSCVLEYVADHRAAVDEINRISGGHAFYCGVEPWTLTSVLYPGARRTLGTAYR